MHTGTCPHTMQVNILNKVAPKPPRIILHSSQEDQQSFLSFCYLPWEQKSKEYFKLYLSFLKKAKWSLGYQTPFLLHMTEFFWLALFLLHYFGTILINFTVEKEIPPELQPPYQNTNDFWKCSRATNLNLKQRVVVSEYIFSLWVKKIIFLSLVTSKI